MNIIAYTNLRLFIKASLAILVITFCGISYHCHVIESGWITRFTRSSEIQNLEMWANVMIVGITCSLILLAITPIFKKKEDVIPMELHNGSVEV